MIQGGASAKIPRVFGRQIIEAFLVAKRPHKNLEQQVNFVIGHGDCEIYTQDWQKCFHAFQIADGRCELDPDGLLHFSYVRQGISADFYMRYDRSELILNVFAGPAEKKQAESTGSMTIVEPVELISFACGLPSQLHSSFKPFLEAQARKRVLFLANSTEISQSLCQSIAVEFKMRFPQIEPENWTEAFEVLWFEFVGFAVSLWTQCLKSAIEPHTGPNSFEYFRRLAASIAGLIAKGADVFQVDRREFLLAVKKFLEKGDPSDIPTASRQIVSDVELALGNVRKRWLLQLTDLFEFTQLFSVSIAIGQAVAQETKELKSLSQMLASWSLSLVNNLTRGPRIVDFRNGVEKLAVAVLQLTDGQRYSQEFHCTLALWKLSELVKASD